MIWLFSRCSLWPLGSREIAQPSACWSADKNLANRAWSCVFCRQSTCGFAHTGGHPAPLLRGRVHNARHWSPPVAGGGFLPAELVLRATPLDLQWLDGVVSQCKIDRGILWRTLGAVALLLLSCLL